ncbi:MAG: cytidylate kinase-like family protein [Veillonellaceae bacterium]|uniref:cytidylate kinase-like family protein n=1 Tax=uncultured Selenomonas sp. TaxID=159275 RepID=UPI0025FD0F62|nr:cytidylate kinase-like family protein [uncultured Selenomonas sp.]MCI7540926.1 cytidylate kinase-like family protein [Veillonellaceae bacterium]MDY6349995.1 cytidylate kinase-like family protein [Selenomonas sp.]
MAKTKLIITVGCEYGCRGPEIAQRIADDLGIPCYDRDLIDDIIEEAGFSKDLLDKAEKGHAIRGRDTGDVDPKKLGAIRYHNLTDRVVFLQRETVRRLAARGSCVFVGRCADHILRHADVKTLNVFIYAPSDVRLKTVMREHNLGKTEAELLITKSDEDLHARYKQVTGTYRGDRHNRHMLIDSSLLGAERTADLIERLAFAHFGIAGAEDVDTSTVETAKAAASLSSAPDLPPVTA